MAGIATLTPVLPAGAREIVMKLFAGVCHQLSSRSPHIDGVQLAVCHRCIGIYWALPIAAIVYRLSRGYWPFKGRLGVVVLLAAALPSGIDWIGDIIGWWTNTPASRMITGSIFGIFAGYYLTKAVGDILRERRHKHRVESIEDSVNSE